MSEVACPSCGRRFKLTAERAGKKGRCACGCRFTFPPLTDPTDIVVAKAKELAPVAAAKGKAAAQATGRAIVAYAPVVGRGLRRYVPLVLYYGVWQPLRIIFRVVSLPFVWAHRRRQARRQAEEEFWAGRENVRDLARRWPVILRMSFHPTRPPTISQFAFAMSLGVVPVAASKQSMMLTLSAAKARAKAGRASPALLTDLNDMELVTVYDFLRYDA